MLSPDAKFFLAHGGFSVAILLYPGQEVLGQCIQDDMLASCRADSHHHLHYWEPISVGAALNSSPK